jgi:dolichyl-phosphate beta-glucosyltransferase
LNTPLLSLVVPCYDEAHRLPSTFEGLRALQRALPFRLEVLLVDDGSRDDTSPLAARLGADLPGFRLLSEPHRGKGGALRAGVLAARGEYVFLADADWSMPPEQVLAFLPPALVDFDVAIASREVEGAVRHGEPLRRHLLGRAFNRLVQLAVLPGIEDSQCGFKCLRRDAAVALFDRSRTDGWAFDVELLVLARERGLRIREIPIDWHYRADSRLRPGRDGLAMARDVLMLAVRHRILRRRSGYSHSPGERSGDPQASSEGQWES